MKYAIAIVFFLMSLSLFSQDFSDIKTRIGLLKTTSNFKLDSTGVSKIQVPTYYCNTNKTDNNWHVQDLNNDGLKDLIFTGPCQPYHQTAIFLNSKKGFQLVYDAPGKILSIKNTTNGTEINSYNPSCCCSYYSSLVKVTINNTSVVKESTISFYDKTVITASDKLYTKAVSGILRSTPVIDDVIKKDPCTGEEIVGNTIGSLKNESAIVVNQEKEWLLVFIKQNGSYAVGWVKK
ncbi:MULTISPECIES: hypothetical protein [unclassified Cellulophaga]|uniref:hypothetical protein n=1 Tax=unclassified Cellulophaga TaxID=2634405 RepID=UPI0026E1ECDA|nr:MULTISPECIES: hypothetical protein [unclassified Cellulophaga]MDO6492876.1 hypothetical protein [Cellulophaga sp. 2_MG-2023]MDO6496378.1 hypothetical protein [Cellulophaga sp. 3_MG-2023]